LEPPGQRHPDIAYEINLHPRMEFLYSFRTVVRQTQTRRYVMYRNVLIGIAVLAMAGAAFAAKDAELPLAQNSAEMYRVMNPTAGSRTDLLNETFDAGIPGTWTVIDGLSDGYTWEGVTDYFGSTLDGTPFAFVNSDAAGYVNMDEELVSPVVACDTFPTVILEFDHYFHTYTGADIADVDVWDGTQWVNVYTTSADVGGWGAPDHQVIDITALKNADLQVRFHYYNAYWEWYWAVDNVVITDAAADVHDVGIASITLYDLPYAVGKLGSLGVTVENFGTLTETDIPVHIEVGSFTLDDQIASLDPGMTEEVTLDFTPTAEAIAPILAQTALPGDENPGNDEFVFSEYFYPEGTVWAQGFEYIASFPPAGWAVFNEDGGSYTWDWYSGIPHTGINMTAVQYEYPNNDDWLITDAITPQANFADSFGLFYAAYSSYYPEYLQIWAMSAQDPSATLDLLFEDPSNAVLDYQNVRLSLDAYDGETIYIGIRSLSPDAYYNLVDDIFYFSVEAVDVAEGQVETGKLSLSMENPMRPNGSLMLSLPSDADVKVNLYDVTGRLVKNLANGRMTAGSHTLQMDGSGLSSGIYLLDVDAGSKHMTRKLVLSR
jgi:hypothetical protein